MSQDGVVRWRRVDLQACIKELFGVEMHERTVGKSLAQLGFVRLSVRPQHPKADDQTQESFKKLRRAWRRSYPNPPATSRSRSGSRMKPASASRAR